MSELLTVITAGAEDVSGYVRMIISGLPGSGKTTFASTAPNPIFAAAYPGFGPLANMGIRYVNITNENDLFNLKLALEEGSVEADTLVVDTVDELQRRLFLQKLKAEGRSNIKSDDWNWVAAKMNGMFDSLSELPLHIIYITHTKDIGGFDGEDHEVRNNLQGSIATQIYQYVDYSVFIERTAALEDVDLTELDSNLTVHSQIRTKPTSKFPVVFDSSNSLPDFIEVTGSSAFQQFIVAQEGKFDALDSSDPEEITIGELEPAEDAPEKVDIPGMSKQDTIAKFLNKD